MGRINLVHGCGQAGGSADVPDQVTHRSGILQGPTLLSSSTFNFVNTAGTKTKNPGVLSLSIQSSGRLKKSFVV
jgi:hypothetical protein